ncbi:hypothetical protein C8R43DRAFT_553426 [Mycena crocata]|nr:hypothetical protein C8R43DRAFT_553426 [Mycena crocata]
MIEGSLRSYKELGRIKRLFRQHEIKFQLKNHQSALQIIIRGLKLRNLTGVSALLGGFETDTERRHQEVLACLESQTLSSVASSTHSYSSTSSLVSLLPPHPKIFHGRQEELEGLVHVLTGNSARIAILGPGGMGKTTLAIATLHHPDVVSKFRHHHFISCEAARSADELISTVGFHLGLEPSRQPIGAIVHFFSQCELTVLVLDNLETAWEGDKSRHEVEEFLASLTTVENLSLLVTIRGTERPGKVKWTRPFLPVLKPLHPHATRQIFIDISDTPSEEEEAGFNEILDLTGHLPLAASLMASVTSMEGYSDALTHWKRESTALVSAGHDKQSNLETSIIVSLTSPRMMSKPTARELLSVLSVLPDGLSDLELTTHTIPLPFILESKSMLLQTSLGYIDVDRRLKALNPIREYIRGTYPPKIPLLSRLMNHWLGMLALWETHQQWPNKDLVSQLTANIGNINSLIIYHEHPEASLPPHILNGIISLTRFSQHMLKSDSVLLPLLPKYLDGLEDSSSCIQWKYLILRLGCSGPPVTAVEARSLIPKTMEEMTSANDISNQALLCYVSTRYYLRAGDPAKATDFNDTGISLISDANFDGEHLVSMIHSARAEIDLQVGRYESARAHAHMGRMAARKAATILDELQCAVSEALALMYLGNLPCALQTLEAAQLLATSGGLQGSDRHLGILDAAAQIAYAQGDYVQAQGLYESMVSQTSLARSPRYYIYASLLLIEIRDRLGDSSSEDMAQISDLHDKSRTLAWNYGVLFSNFLTANARRSRDPTAHGASFLVECFHSAQQSNDTEMMLKCLDRLTENSAGLDQVEDIFHWTGTYIALARNTKNWSHTYQSLRSLGDICFSSGDLTTAMAAFVAVLEGSKQMEALQREADCLLRIGDIFYADGNQSKAKSHWLDARQLYLKLSLTREVSKMDGRINMDNTVDNYITT